MPTSLLQRLQRIRPVLSIGALVAVVAAFVVYAVTHRSLLTQLSHTSIGTILATLGLYGAFFVSLGMIFHAGLRMCRVRMPAGENFLLNGYSTLANFFVPGQSGPIIRGAYLKKRYQVPVKQYVLATLFYYGLYALVSIILLLAPNRPWWQTVCAVIAVSVLSLVVIQLYRRRRRVSDTALDVRPQVVAYLAAATVLQALVQIMIYRTELQAVVGQVSLASVVTYTGAANFALFVALTPGAIGIRESFLVFTGQLHHLSNATIVSASVIDRGVFLLFLALLFVILAGFHAKRRLHITSMSQTQSRAKE